MPQHVLFNSSGESLKRLFIRSEAPVVSPVAVVFWTFSSLIIVFTFFFFYGELKCVIGDVKYQWELLLF